MTVNTKMFVEAMDKRWKTELGNCTNTGLREIWAQIADTFNRQIEDRVDQTWQILQPPTGTGKTQSIALYCSFLSSLRSSLSDFTSNIQSLNCQTVTERMHPGVLVVVRLIAEADKLADQINGLAKKKTAIAYHSENRCAQDEVIASPVIIVTHAAYQNAMKHSAADGIYDCNWLLFHQWFHGRRGLVIIDEALGLIDEFQVNSEALKQTLAHIPDVREEIGIGYIFTSVIQAINRVQCRRVVDDLENCDPTQVYLMLPSGSVGERFYMTSK